MVGTLWRRSVLETRRAEAASSSRLAQVQLETDPTEALAYATSSLELADTQEARIFAVRALWAGPPLRALDLAKPAERPIRGADLQPRRAVARGGGDSQRKRAGLRRRWAGSRSSSAAMPCLPPARSDAPGRDGLLVTGHWTEGRARIWAMPEGRLVREIDFGGTASWQVGDDAPLCRGQNDLTSTTEATGVVFALRAWKLPEGEPEELGLINWAAVGASSSSSIPADRAWIYTKGDSFYSRPLPAARGNARQGDRPALVQDSPSIGIWGTTAGALLE